MVGKSTIVKDVKPKKKVLLFTVASETGPNAVAANIKAKFDEHGFETQTIDLFAASPEIVKVLSGFRLKARFWFTRVSNLFWKRAQRKENGLYDKLVWRIKDVIIPLINEFEPDIIISTHVAGQILISTYGSEISKPFCDYFIITNYVVPPAIKPLRGAESFIVVPTVDFKKELENRCYNGTQLLTFGIPINENFYKVLFKIDILPKLGFNNFDTEAPTVLISGGGEGLGKIAGVVKRLSENPELQIITVCGRNEELKIKIDKIVRRNAEKKKSYARIYNHGFCTNMEELMSVAHFSLGKTGGVSSTEAIAKGLQVVSLKNIPYPELANLKYLESKEVAKSVSSITELEYYVALKPEGRAESDSLVEYSADKILNHVLESLGTKQ